MSQLVGNNNVQGLEILNPFLSELCLVNYLEHEYKCMCCILFKKNIYLFIYLFIMYTIVYLYICLQARRGHQTSLQMVVSHHVVAGN